MRSTISGCEALIAWLGGTFPPEGGTTFCPSNAALDAFARASGLRNWAALFAAAQANAAQWRPYLQRVVDYHQTSAAVLSLSVIATGSNGPYQTQAVAKRAADGAVLEYATWRVQRSGKKTLTLITPSNQRATVTDVDVVNDPGAQLVATDYFASACKRLFVCARAPVLRCAVSMCPRSAAD